MTNNNTESKHITITGFIGDKIDKPSKKIKAGQQKIKTATENISEAKKNFEDAFNLTIKAFKQDTIDKISQTEKKIEELRDKITNTSEEIETVYLDYIVRLEQSKNDLLSKLGEYKELGAEDWNSFKHEFNDEIDDFETSVTYFLKKHKLKEEEEDKTSS